jgi:hypothetical protein
MEDLRSGLYAICSTQRPVTVRQVFYRAVAAGLVEKTETEYKATVARLLSAMRRDGSIPYHWISDPTRRRRKVATFDGMADMMSGMHHQYRRDLWSRSNVEVEIWLEKEALAGVLGSVCDEYDVALMVTRGYPSLSFTYEAAQMLGMKTETYIYYFGDLDNHGLQIEQTVQNQLYEHGCYGFTFERIAITEQQVSAWNLPTRPDKSGGGWAIEVDAIEPNQLRELCRDAIEQHVDASELEYLRGIERLEKDVLSSFQSAFRRFDTLSDDDYDDADQLAEMAGIAEHEGSVALLKYMIDSST